MTYNKKQIEELMYKDYRKKENRKLINEELLKLKFFRKYKDTNKKVPLEKIEDFISMIVVKKKITPQWTMMMYKDDVTLYTCSMKTDADDKHDWLGNVTACRTYELIAKMALFLFHTVKLLKIEDREEVKKYHDYAKYEISKIEEKYKNED